MKIDVKGLNKVTEAFRTLKNTFDKNLEEKVKQETNDLCTDVKYYVPVNTGYLRQNIFPRVVKESNGAISGEVFSNVEYAAYVEFGTGKVGESAGLVREGIDLAYRQTPWRYQDEDGNWHYTEGMLPQPYFYPAMKEHEQSIADRFGSVVKLEIK